MYTVKGVLILDNDGERILSKVRFWNNFESIFCIYLKWYLTDISHNDVFGFQYYDDTYPTVKEQKEFEKNLFNKTSRVNGRCPCVLSVAWPALITGRTYS
jgi:hypothetical protein